MIQLSDATLTLLTRTDDVIPRVLPTTLRIARHGGRGYDQLEIHDVWQLPADEDGRREIRDAARSMRNAAEAHPDDTIHAESHGLPILWLKNRRSGERPTFRLIARPHIQATLDRHGNVYAHGDPEERPTRTLQGDIEGKLRTALTEALAQHRRPPIIAAGDEIH